MVLQVVVGMVVVVVVVAGHDARLRAGYASSCARRGSRQDGSRAIHGCQSADPFQRGHWLLRHGPCGQKAREKEKKETLSTRKGNLEMKIEALSYPFWEAT